MNYTDPKTGKFIKGNPGGGRPKGFSIVAHLKEKLQEVPEGQKESYANLIVKKYLHKALVEGDNKILTDLIDRVDGKALQRIGDPDGNNVVFKIEMGGNNPSVQPRPKR